MPSRPALVRASRAALLPAVLVGLAACSGGTADETDTPSGGTGHGAVEGAAEVGEPQLHLVSIDDRGRAALLDLLTEEEVPLDAVDAPDVVQTDGRYVFSVTDTGVDVVDSGVWTWDHADHFHYYRSEPRAVGRVDGAGPASIATGALSTAGGTGVFFPGSGEAVLLNNAALSKGVVEETLRLEVGEHDGLVAPLGDGAVVSEPDAAGRAAAVQVVDAEGEEIGSAACPDASGTITTRVGLVVGCADGALLVTLDDGEPTLEPIAYPDDAAAPATSFAGRKGRPTVAGLGDDAGVWLLDTRERSWQWIETDAPLVTAAAADDADEHVVVVAEDGTVRVLDGASGRELARTDPLLASSLDDPELAAGLSLTVDAQRAYVNAAADGVVHEIDYADGARVARTLTPPTRPVHVAETGR